MAVEHIKHWQVGDVEIARIVEINNFEDDMSMLLPNATAEWVKTFDWLRPNFTTAAGRMLISFQAFVLRSKGKHIMIDTCIGSDRKREYDVFCNLKSTFLEDLTAAGFPANSINAVLCTHMHFDHVGWNTHLVNGKWVPTFQNARYLFNKVEWDHWKQLRDTGGYHHMDHLVDSIDPIVASGQVDCVDGEHRLTDEVSLIPTPGHTPGHVSVVIRSKGQEAVITGDMMHHPIQLATLDIEGNFDMDKAQGKKTRREFVERYADKSTLIIGSHFCDPTAGHIVRHGDSYRFNAK